MIRSTLRNTLIKLKLIEKPDFTIECVSDHPDKEHLLSGCIYIVGGKTYQKWAYFMCPSGNGDVLQLSLMEKHRPRWKVQLDWLGRPTVHPSIRQSEGSFAHFWVNKGKVLWCSDTGLPIRKTGYY